MERDLVELQRREPAGDVGARGVERHVPEIEEARVADHDVQAERHHREDEHHDHRARARHEVADEREVLQGVDDEGVEHAEGDERRRPPTSLARSARAATKPESASLMRSSPLRRPLAEDALRAGRRGRR